MLLVTALLASGFVITIEGVIGTAITIGMGVIGYYVYTTRDDLKQVDTDSKARDIAIDKRLTAECERSTDHRHALRNEFNAGLLQEEVRRKEGLGDLETRTNTMIQRVIDLMNAQHADLKDYIKTVIGTNVR